MALVIRNRRKQQVLFLIAFPAVIGAAFLIGKILDFSEPLLVACGFLSAIVLIFGFYSLFHGRLSKEEKGNPPKPDWIRPVNLGIGCSQEDFDRVGFEVLRRCRFDGVEHLLFGREEAVANGTWRQEIETASGFTCAYSLHYVSDITMFGDDGTYAGKGRLIKPPVISHPTSG